MSHEKETVTITANRGAKMYVVNQFIVRSLSESREGLISLDVKVSVTPTSLRYWKFA